MIKEKKIEDFDQIKDLVFDLGYDPSSDRNRGYYLFRGLPNESYELKTSLQMNCGDRSSDLENKLLNNFKKYTATDTNHEDDNVWRRMILGQHHGLPTRLLDWTHSPLVALHFAVSDGTSRNLRNNNKCVVWRINAEELYKKLPEGLIKNTNDKVATRIFSVEMLREVAQTLEDYDKKIKDYSMVVLEPPSIDPRIVNQYSFFTVVPRDITNIEKFFMNIDDSVVAEKYVINADLKWQIRDFLDEVNISERTLFPGLDGICDWLARHYYVK